MLVKDSDWHGLMVIHYIFNFRDLTPNHDSISYAFCLLIVYFGEGYTELLPLPDVKLSHSPRINCVPPALNHITADTATLPFTLRHSHILTHTTKRYIALPLALHTPSWAFTHNTPCLMPFLP